MTPTLRHMPYVPVTWPDRRPRHLRRTLASPLGTLTLLSDGEALTGLLLPGETPASGLMGAQAERLGAQADQAATALLATAAAQLDEYFAGRRRAFDLPLRLRGTPFQQRVWQTLLDIPYGDTVSYKDVAAHAGRPGAARAAGAAVGRNPIAVIVPCHRVVGADGSLTGYAGGLPAKRALLRLERDGVSAAR